MEIIPIQDKMKIYREMRAFSQQDLAEASGISLSTIKKYEAGILKPKIDQIRKIADALAVSVYLFIDFDIETISDVFTLLYKMEEEIDMTYEVKMDENGKPDYQSFRLVFTNETLNHYLHSYMKSRDLEKRIYNQPDLFQTKEEYDEAVKKSFLKTLELRMALCLDDTLISKGTEHPGESKYIIAAEKEYKELLQDPEVRAEWERDGYIHPSRLKYKGFYQTDRLEPDKDNKTDAE